MCQGCEFEQNKFEDPEITLLKEQLSASRLAFVSVHEAYLAMQADRDALAKGINELINEFTAESKLADEKYRNISSAARKEKAFLRTQSVLLRLVAARITNKVLEVQESRNSERE